MWHIVLLAPGAFGAASIKRHAAMLSLTQELETGGVLQSVCCEKKICAYYYSESRREGRGTVPKQLARSAQTQRQQLTMGPRPAAAENCSD